ncbi:hypothetical protein BU24DRAFT_425862 [Aaosphaeria arxii CBS 175.79]|uniref:Uncharacterized protein n=1 Tax=Aaosphaeria arxii CBS 175.79 TaxID=1450172 RepID=A0A6A5XG33_9PLEO|nr:uncharacterized protein BU24DRAFT_425862 [Aaosphaeria arxii CBS 175.79]KAF2012042.1 hypothetical protein BU24DRAFT_425862 [Aaosphaeria arxii CBS 175.79]
MTSTPSSQTFPIDDFATTPTPTTIPNESPVTSTPSAQFYIQLYLIFPNAYPGR